MHSAETRIPARYYLRFSDILVTEGQDFQAVLRKAGIRDNVLTDAAATFSVSEVDALIAQACQACRRTDIGIDLGRLVSVNTHNVVGFGMVSSPNFGAALQFMARYFKLIVPSFRMQYLEEASHTDLLFTPTVAMSHLSFACHLDAIATASMRLFHDMLGRRTPLCKIYFSMDEPAYSARYAELGDIAVAFNAGNPGVRLRFKAVLTQFPLALADTDAFRFAEERCRALVQHVAGDGQFAAWVEMMLREASGGLPSLAELASILNLSTRTLSRYLRRENTSFRDVAGQVQMALARERLAAGTASITDVAHSLGFSDSANFARAFRSKAGMSPRAYRSGQRAPQAGAGHAPEAST
ncbi:MAG: AraC family transcriptional regulator ligand-binding domain-containing protein [Solimonas sp.]